MSRRCNCNTRSVEGFEFRNPYNAPQDFAVSPYAAGQVPFNLGTNCPTCTTVEPTRSPFDTMFLAKYNTPVMKQPMLVYQKKGWYSN